MLVAAILAAACGSAGAQQATAPASPGGGSFDGLLEVLQLKGKAAPAEPFVVQSRPKAEAPFVPVGTPHADRTVKVKTAAEVAAMEAELDAARIRQQRRAGQVPAIVPLKQQTGAKSVTNTAR